MDRNRMSSQRDGSLGVLANVIALATLGLLGIALVGGAAWVAKFVWEQVL